MTEFGYDAWKGKTLTINQVVMKGAFLTYAYDCSRQWKRYDVNIGTPDASKLFNFEVPLGKDDTILVLDPYGDEQLSTRMRRAIFKTKPGRLTLGVRYSTGEIVQVGFLREMRTTSGCPEEGEAPGEEPITSLTFSSFNNVLHIPQMYRSYIPNLKGKKRPFSVGVLDGVLHQFHDRWASYCDIEDNVIVDLKMDIPPDEIHHKRGRKTPLSTNAEKYLQRLQVHGQFFRLVGDWMS